RVAVTEWPTITDSTPAAITISQISTVRRRGMWLRTLTQILSAIEVMHRASGKTTPQEGARPKETAMDTAPISMAAIAAELAAAQNSQTPIIGVNGRFAARPGPVAVAVAWGIRGSSTMGPAPSTTIAQIAACGDSAPSPEAITGAAAKVTSFRVAAMPRARGIRPAETR